MNASSSSSNFLSAARSPIFGSFGGSGNEFSEAGKLASSPSGTIGGSGRETISVVCRCRPFVGGDEAATVSACSVDNTGTSISVEVPHANNPDGECFVVENANG